MYDRRFLGHPIVRQRFFAITLAVVLVLAFYVAFRVLWGPVEIPDLLQMALDVLGNDVVVVGVLSLAFAVFGTAFAVLAMSDAFRAAETSELVLDAIGSFRLSFDDILEGMIEIIQGAEKEVRILMPVPAYGFLFGQEKLSRNLVETIEKFVKNGDHGERRITIYLVGGEVPQKYIQHAIRGSRDQPEGEVARESKNEVAKKYKALGHRIFDLRDKYGDRVRMRYLDFDPYVRIVVADLADPETQRCFMAFTQQESSTPRPDFRAKGFLSRRREMVRAVADLLDLYDNRFGRDGLNGDARRQYTEITPVGI